MADKDPDTPTDDGLAQLRGHIASAFFGTSLACCLAGAALSVWLTTPQAGWTRSALVVGYLVGAVCCGRALRLPHSAAQRAAPGVLLMLLLLIGSANAANGWGLAAPGLGFLALISCMACAVMSRRNGLLVAGMAAALSIALGAAQWLGWIGSGPGPSQPARLTVTLLSVVAGVAAGLAVARQLAAHVEDAVARQSRFQGLLSIAAEAYWEAGPDLRLKGAWLRDLQGKFVRITGPRPEKLLAVDDVKITAEALNTLRQALVVRQPLRDLPIRWCDASGQWLDALVSGQPRFSLSGQFLGYWGVGRDVTRQRQADQALQQSQAWLRALVSTSPDVMTLTDLSTGRYIVVNAAFSQFSGWSAEEAVGRSAMELGIWADAGEREKLVRALAVDEIAAEMSLRFRTRSGEVKALMVLASRFSQDGRQYLVINARDLSQSQRERQERDAILANASVGIALTRGGRFVMANPRFDEIYGWPPGELVGREPHSVWPDPAQAQAYSDEVAAGLRQGEAVQTERWTERRDGTPFLVKLRGKAIDPQHPSQGGTIWIAEDITSQRRAEIELARARDAAEAANQAKSDFLANTSHE